MSDNDEDAEIDIPELENGTISLYEWISRDKLKSEEENKALESFEGHLLLVKEIDQKYTKFLSPEDKAFMTKVNQKLKSYEKAQAEIQAIITELVTSSEKLNSLKTKINLKGVNRDVNTRLRLKLIERKDRKLRYTLVRADTHNANNLIKDLETDFPRIVEVANILEDRFHHNLGRFTNPGTNEKDSPATAKSSKSGNKELAITIEINGALLSKETAEEIFQSVENECKELNNTAAKLTRPLGNGIQKKNTVRKMQKRKLSTGPINKRQEKYKAEIPMKCSIFLDGPNDKGVQTDVFDCDYEDFSDGEDVFLVEISEDESDQSTGTD